MKWIFLMRLTPVKLSVYFAHLHFYSKCHRFTEHSAELHNHKNMKKYCWIKVNVNRTCIYCVLFVCFQFNFSRFEGFLCSPFTSIHIIKKGKKSNDAILEQCQGGFDLKIPSLSLQTEQQKRGKFCKCPYIIQLKICPNGPLPAFEYNWGVCFRPAKPFYLIWI